jgi:hypothetical protein
MPQGRRRLPGHRQAGLQGQGRGVPPTVGLLTPGRR